jgi:hypothetical protein
LVQLSSAQYLIELQRYWIGTALLRRHYRLPPQA